MAFLHGNNMKRKLLIFIGIVFISLYVEAQITVTPRNGQNVQTIVENNFLGGGVTVSNVKFNGSTIVNSNQFGTFYNGSLTNPLPADTAAPNVALRSGLVMVTGDVMDAGAGTSSGIVSSTSSPNSSDQTNIIPLINELTALGLGAQSKNDIAALSFDFISIGDEISFRYVFASEEYPQYVCSNFNDAFGFFIDGPYDPVTGNYATDQPPSYNLRWKNIAIIPDSYPEQAVTINTVNGGVAAGTASPCVLTNTQFFRTNTNNNCKMNGYTVALSTKAVSILPCYKYKLLIAMCDVGDASYNSTVFLEGNSFRADEYNLKVDKMGKTDGDTLIKGCSKARVNVTLNRPREQGDAEYNLTILTDMVEGVDYTLPGHSIAIPIGDTTTFVDILFQHSATDIPGEIKEFMIISEETGASACVPRDTTRIYVKVPQPLTHTISNDTVFCRDMLPKRFYFETSTLGGIGNVTYTWSSGDSLNKPRNSKLITDTITFFLNISDECGREIFDLIHVGVNEGFADISADKEFLCEGDTVNLTCSSSSDYSWTAVPADLSLSAQANQQNPSVTPLFTTKYIVLTQDRFGCTAKDSVTVKVIPQIEAKMNINPTKVNFSNTEVEFKDITSGSISRFWDFGDGGTASSKYGTHVFPNSEQMEYEVMMIAENDACVDTAFGKVLVVPDFVIFLPNTFIPASYGINSIFRPFTSMDIEYTLTILDRWGGQIISIENPGGWDGKLKNGDYAPEGVYVWYLVYRDGDGVRQKLNGTVNLIKGKE